MGRITVIGTGFEEKQLTLEAVELLQSGAKALLHTGRCGCAEWLARRGIPFETLDELYEQCEDFDEHARLAAEAVCRAAEAGDVVYGVFDVRDRSVSALLGLRSGLSPETSLELTKDLISQPVILERLRKASSILDSGETFSRALTESGLFGGMEGRLITISFYSGSSDETFRRLSRQYTERSIDLISQAISIVEPTIVILLSLLVGLVLLSVMMPLLGILSDFAM